MDRRVALEREKRNSQLQDKILELDTNPAIVSQLALIGGVGSCFVLGKQRIIQRDLAGVLAGLSAVVALGNAGIRDKYALMAAFTAVAGAYAMAVRPTESETLIELQPTTLLGSDNKLFFWDWKDLLKQAALGPIPSLVDLVQ